MRHSGVEPIDNESQLGEHVEKLTMGSSVEADRFTKSSTKADPLLPISTREISIGSSNCKIMIITENNINIHWIQPLPVYFHLWMTAISQKKIPSGGWMQGTPERGKAQRAWFRHQICVDIYLLSSTNCTQNVKARNLIIQIECDLIAPNETIYTVYRVTYNKRQYLICEFILWIICFKTFSHKWCNWKINNQVTIKRKSLPWTIAIWCRRRFCNHGKSNGKIYQQSLIEAATALQ